MNLLKFMNQRALYWAPASVDTYGQKTYGDPQEILCRWESSTEVMYTSAGEEIHPTEYLLVDRDLQEGGLVWEGTLTRWDDSVSITPEVDGVFVIYRFDKTPDKKVKTILREAYAGKGVLASMR